MTDKIKMVKILALYNVIIFNSNNEFKKNLCFTRLFTATPNLSESLDANMITRPTYNKANVKPALVK